MELHQTINRLKGLYLSIRNDPGNLAILRSILLSGALCLMTLYTGHTLFLEPKQKKIEQLVQEQNRLDHLYPGLADNTLARAQIKLTAEIKGLKEQIAQGELQARILEKNWQAIGDPKRFNKIIFTLDPSAPIDMRKGINRTDNLEARSDAGFKLFPLSMEGNTDFNALYTYLRYLEGRSEVAFIESLSVSNNSDRAGGQKPEISFKMILGRVQRNKTI